MRLWSPIQKLAKKRFFFHKFRGFFFKIFHDTHIKKISVGQMIACYKQNIHLLLFADVFLKGLFVFAGGGGDSSIGHYGGEIAQLILGGKSTPKPPIPSKSVTELGYLALFLAKFLFTLSDRYEN